MSRLLFILALACAFPAHAQVGYFTAIEDLPLPPGFSESANAAGFEGGEGRLIAVSAEGAADPLSVRDFYHRALPPLGWAAARADDGTLTFLRGRERLTFTAERIGDRTRLGAQLVILAAPNRD